MITGIAICLASTAAALIVIARTQRNRSNSASEVVAAAVADIDSGRYRWLHSPDGTVSWTGPLGFVAVVRPVDDNWVVQLHGRPQVTRGRAAPLGTWSYPRDHDRSACERASVAYTRTFIETHGHPIRHRPDCMRVIADALADIDAGAHQWARDDDAFAAELEVDQHWRWDGPADHNAYLEVRGDTITALVYGPVDLLGDSTGPLSPDSLRDARHSCVTTIRQALCQGVQLCHGCPVVHSSRER